MNKWQEGVNYFRIVEVTKSGTHLYSTSNQVLNGNEEKINLTPNPTKDTVSLTYEGFSCEYIVNVYNATGEKLETFQRYETGAFSFGTNYGLGLYFVEVVTPNKTQMFKFFKEA